jgi:hypothetical protein
MNDIFPKVLNVKCQLPRSSRKGHICSSQGQGNPVTQSFAGNIGVGPQSTGMDTVGEQEEERVRGSVNSQGCARVTRMAGTLKILGLVKSKLGNTPLPP